MTGIDALEAIRVQWASLDETARVAFIRQRSAEGWSGAVIADAVGITEDMVSAIRIRHGIEPAHGRRVDIRVAPRRLETVERMTADGRTDAEIATELGLAEPSTVSRYRARYRLRTPRTDLGLDMARVFGILEMHASGSTMAVAAAAYGCDISTIARMFRRQGWTWGRANCGGRNRRDDIRAAVVNAAADGLVPSEIAERVGVSRGRVSAIIGEMGLATRRQRPSAETTAARIRLLLSTGCSRDQVARDVGVSMRQIERISRRFGITLPGNSKK